DRAKLNRALTFVVSADGIRHHWQHFFAHVRVTRELFWRRDVRHFGLVTQTRFVAMERYQHRKNPMPMLAGRPPPGGEALAVPDTIDVVYDRYFRIARQ